LISKIYKKDDTAKINHKELVVGYAGTIGQANKVDLILKSARILKNKTNIIFKILGDEVLKDQYLEDYKDLSNVEFFPKVKKK